jgi:Xaa-Pro aminopeptidase
VDKLYTDVTFRLLERVCTMIDDLDALMEDEGVDAILAEGHGFEVPDIYWLTGFLSPDSISVLKNIGEDVIVATGFNTLDRVTKESHVKRTHDLSETYLMLMRNQQRAIDNPDAIYKDFLANQFSGTIIGVPSHLPAHVLIAIQKLGYEIKVVPHLLKNARATKTAKEVKMIKNAGAATINAISVVAELIKDADVGANKILMLKGNPLTVAELKMKLDHTLLDFRAESAEDAILAVGKKGFDWHYLGSPKDRLKAGVPIILDVFPRLKSERYVADVTRTFFKGTPNKKVKEMYEAVQAAADASADALTDGAMIDDVNMACFKTLERYGFDSRRLNSEAKDGMTHGLGHGIGLDVHENPSMYRYKDHFKDGHVMAIEPGVYLKSVGGVRIENDFLVTKRKAKRLTPGLDEYFL